MPKRNNIYRPIFPKRWYSLGRVRAWRSEDHVLIVETRWLREYYTRMYWADIQSLLLYGLHGQWVVLVVLEVACVLGLVMPLLSWKVPWAFAPATLFLLIYAGWRFARPNWACQVSTRTNSKRFAIPGTLVSCRRVFNDLKNSAGVAQKITSEETKVAGGQVTAPPVLLARSRRREPMLAVHVIAFVLGLLSSFHIAFFVVYCITLAVAYYIEQDFEFPMAVRSAAVMGRILAVLQIGFWIFENARFSFVAPFPFDAWQFSAPRVLMSLYGIAAIYRVSLERTKPQRKVSTVLGLS